MDILYESTHIFYGFIGITSLIITYATINQHANSKLNNSPSIQEEEEVEPIKSTIIPEAEVEPIKTLDIFNNDKSKVGGKRTKRTKCTKCKNKNKKTKKQKNIKNKKI
jgi:hypothetical protein